MQNPLLERLMEWKLMVVFDDRGQVLHDHVKNGLLASLPDIISALEERDRLREAVEEYKALEVLDCSMGGLADLISNGKNMMWRTQRDAITKKFNL